MNRDRGKEAIEFVGIAAVVASLVFVGFQLRQDRAVRHTAVCESKGSAEYHRRRNKTSA